MSEGHKVPSLRRSNQLWREGESLSLRMRPMGGYLCPCPGGQTHTRVNMRSMNWSQGLSVTMEKRKNVKMKTEGRGTGEPREQRYIVMTNEDTGTWNREEDLVGGDSFTGARKRQ